MQFLSKNVIINLANVILICRFGIFYEGDFDMKTTWKAWLSVLFYLLGILGWCYVGGWMLLTGPVFEIFLAYRQDCLTLGRLCMEVMQGFIYLSLAGGVWCVGYMLSNYFREA